MGWVIQGHGEVFGVVHAPVFRDTGGVYPVAKVSLDAGWPIVIGQQFAVGPGVFLDVAWGTDAEAPCEGYFGCVYPSFARGAGVGLSNGLLSSDESYVAGFFGVGLSGIYDTGFPVPRARFEWGKKSGIVYGFDVSGRLDVMVKLGIHT